MEKKTKKLQFKKETIVILDGNKMSNVQGGGAYEKGSECPGESCQNGGVWIADTSGPFTGRCKCKPTFLGDFCQYALA